MVRVVVVDAWAATFAATMMTTHSITQRSTLIKGVQLNFLCGLECKS